MIMLRNGDVWKAKNVLNDSNSEIPKTKWPKLKYGTYDDESEAKRLNELFHQNLEVDSDNDIQLESKSIKQTTFSIGNVSATSGGIAVGVQVQATPVSVGMTAVAQEVPNREVKVLFRF
jgi:hypothetical protein